MKIIILILGLFFLYCCFFADEGTTEKLNSAANVISNKSTNKIVGYAGKSDVIVDMAEKRVANLRVKLIGLKTSKKTLERKLNDDNLSPEMKEKLTLTLKKVETCEKNGEVALAKAKQNLTTIKAKVNMIETDIAVSKTATNLINDANPTLENNELEKLIESFETDLDNANAQLDVALLEAN